MRRILTRLGLIGVSLLIGLLLTEASLRVFRLAPAQGVVTVTESEFRTLPGIFAPGQRLIDRQDPRLPHHLTINHLGYRGPDVSVAKREGEVRVLVIGDSFTYGSFVDDGQTLPARLEQALGPRCESVRVINAGLGDATIVDEAKMLERGLRMAPDLVILIFSENDVVDLSRPSTWDRLAENRRAKSRFPLSILYPGLRRTALWNLGLRVRAAGRARAHPARVDWTFAGRADSITPRLREAYRQALVAMRDTLAAREIRFVLVAYPSHLSLESEEKRGQVAWITETAAHLGVPAINLAIPLAAAGIPIHQLYLLPYDGHPSPLGYEIAAAYLADRISSGATIAGSCSRLEALRARNIRSAGR